jgi:predicted enzyme related to lactoylglutathione lyase
MIVGARVRFAPTTVGVAPLALRKGRTIMGQPVVHWEIGARNGSKLHEFYRALFDWKIQVDPQFHYGMVETGGEGGINGGISTLPAEAHPYVTVYVQVDDLESYLAKAESMGGTTILPPMPVGEIGSIAMFTDPESHIVGLFKPA